MINKDIIIEHEQELCKKAKGFSEKSSVKKKLEEECAGKILQQDSFSSCEHAFKC